MPEETFKEQLKSVGLTQAMLAERLGVSEQTVCRWKGKIPLYAKAYLDLLIKRKKERIVITQKIRDLQEKVKELTAIKQMIKKGLQDEQ